MSRRSLVQGQMCSKFVVIVDIGHKDAAQMGFPEDDDVIEAFAADRADEPLRMPVLPGRPRGGRVIPDAQRSKTLSNGEAVGGVAVTYDVGRCTVPREGIGDLAGDPLRRRMGRHRQ